MKTSSVFFVLVFALVCTACSPAPEMEAEKPRLDLMPYPQQVSVGSGHFQLDGEFTVTISGTADERLSQAVQRFFDRAEQQTGLVFPQRLASANASLRITVNSDNSRMQDAAQALPTPQENYQLHIAPNGIALNAASTTGALRGLETLLQLVGVHWDERGQPVSLPALTIEDYPRFPWRGVLIDSVRHFLSVDTLKRQIDGMAAAKYNVFHWHLTDDQGWRLESKAYPRLHETAPGGNYYSHDEVREIVAYAKARGIEVMPEIDMPGHASAIAVAYPELMSAPGPYQPEDRWGVHTPLLNPANDAVYEFADKILGEVASLFPFAYVHIGGDEVNPQHWQENAQIQAFMQQQGLEDAEALHAYFNQRIATILAKHNRRMIGWDEIRHPALPKDIVIQSWRGPDALGEAVNHGYQAILSTGFYLDQPQPAAYHYRNRVLPQPLQVKDSVEPGESWRTWSFTIPRKRGSAVRGTLTLITRPNGDERGFIDFAGKSRKAVHDIETHRGVTRFWLDTWMGRFEPRLRLQDGQVSGEVLVANAKYPVTGEQIAGSNMPGSQLPQGDKPALVDDDHRHLVLGGEAALWSELIDEHSIDLRLWPRAFVVAERLWSAEDLRDEDFMYERLAAVSRWAEVSVGLEHRTQSSAALKRLTDGQYNEPLVILAGAVEPAQYYHRHHEKSVNETYSRRDPLNRFADALPAESTAVRQLSKNIDAWLQQPESAEKKAAVVDQLSAWAANHHRLQQLINLHPNLEPLRSIAEDVHSVATLGLELVSRLKQQQPMSENEYQEALARLAQAQEIQQEIVVAAAYPVEKLLKKVDDLERFRP